MPTQQDDCGCKVGRLSGSVPTDIDTQLRERWTGDTRESTRDLAAWFNRQVLAAALSASDIATKDGDVANYYRLLTDDDVTSGDRVEARRELERAGVDVEALDSRFVSHQTIHRHLTDCLDLSLSPPDPQQRLADAQQTIGELQGRTEAVTADTIRRLADHDILDIGAPDVFVSVQVTCTECNRQYAARTLLDDGGCDCQ